MGTTTRPTIARSDPWRIRTTSSFASASSANKCRPSGVVVKSAKLFPTAVSPMSFRLVVSMTEIVPLRSLAVKSQRPLSASARATGWRSFADAAHAFAAQLRIVPRSRAVGAAKAWHTTAAMAVSSAPRTVRRSTLVISTLLLQLILEEQFVNAFHCRGKLRIICCLLLGASRQFGQRFAPEPLHHRLALRIGELDGDIGRERPTLAGRTFQLAGRDEDSTVIIRQWDLLKHIALVVRSSADDDRPLLLLAGRGDDTAADVLGPPVHHDGHRPVAEEALAIRR